MKIAVVGAGISGLSVARLLNGKHDVTVYEKDAVPGGLIKCERVNGSLFHTCGGHVFNSKRRDVLDWFWSHFKQEETFNKTERNSVVNMGTGGINIPYPIENNIFLFDKEIQKKIISDWIKISKEKETPNNFEEFLRGRFGDTLYDMYFKPYNEKVWRRNLKEVPLSWLEGKLPMPTVEEMIFNNINQIKEKSFVHSTFWYEKFGGSQFIADTLVKDVCIRYSCPVEHIEYKNKDKVWTINNEYYDVVVFCGNIKQLVHAIEGLDVSQYYEKVDALEYHGTTAVFCEIDKNPYSWIYLPSGEHESHRVICTGNFAESNNDPSLPSNRITATIEFTDEIEKSDIIDNLCKMPYHPRYITHKYNKYTYPIQHSHTREVIKKFKEDLLPVGLFLTGRFADWEYYNMDIAIGAAMDTVREIELRYCG